MNKILNIAVIAHVDAGKSTLVDAFLNQSGVFRVNEEVVDCVMDSDDIERERGITIYAKNCSIMYKDIKINIVDTPGHADFSSEVERIIKTVDTVILLVDSSEGPMPQTRFVLQKSLELGLNPILLINKIDKPDQRAEEVVDEVFDLFCDLGATDEQLHFPILYGTAREGIVQKEFDVPKTDLTDLFETLLEHCDVYPDSSDQPLQMQVSSLAYDDYIGRLGIGRIFQGKLKAGQRISVVDGNGNTKDANVVKLFNYVGMQRTEVNEAFSGDIVVFSGIADISIGDTLCNPDHILPMESITVEEPRLSMNFLVNDSPFTGQSGKFVTSRQLRERLERELEVNVGLRVEDLENAADGFKVSGRGELHLSILLENLRREGYELAVSKPEVIYHMENGKKVEPLEFVIVDTPETYSGAVIEALNLRKGQMENMTMNEGFVRMEFSVPTRGLIGYRQQFINETRGEGIMTRSDNGFCEDKGFFPGRKNGVLVCNDTGEAMGYSLANCGERGILFINPQEKVYEGMVVGIHARENDLVVNVCKNKSMTNVRSSGKDDAIKLKPPKILSLEEALEFIESDELVEVTPDAIRLRKKYLTDQARKIAKKEEKYRLDQEAKENN
ncbi:MAG: translational GTPase TypA [Mycoplasmatales bacterium]